MMPDPLRARQPPVAAGHDRDGAPWRDAGVRAAGGPRAPVVKPKAGATGQSLWSTFWQEFALENAIPERCHVPGDGRFAVDRHWARFADGLPAGARVIDLGCGAGIVGRTLLGRRADLAVAGVDWANVPVIGVANLTIHPWVSMEDLPFGDACFDAAVSLFGIEYGDLERTARQLQRVLKPGARFGFLVHHRDGEIVREGCARRKALKELIAGRMKTAFLTGSSAAIGEQRRVLKQAFPAEPMVRIVSDHFLRNVDRTRAERQAIWQTLSDGLDPELALLLHLDRAAKSATEMAAWLAALLAAMRLVSVSVLRRGGGAPIAWDVSGVR